MDGAIIAMHTKCGGGLHVVIGEGVAPSGKEDDVIEGRGLR